MFKNKAKIKTLEAELARTKHQLHKANAELRKANTELSKEKAFSSYCWDDYARYICKCEALTKEINALKTENKKLDLIIKTFKAVEQAHSNCTKEA